MASNENEFDDMELKEEKNGEPDPSAFDENEYAELALDDTIEVKCIWLIHIYNISPKHFKFITGMYKEEIVAVLTHKNNYVSFEETGDTFQTDDGKIIDVKTKCVEKPHHHIVIKLDKPKSKIAFPDDPMKKWFGFSTNNRAVETSKGKYTAEAIWNKAFPDQPLYKSIGIYSKEHYLNLAKYFEKRIQTEGNMCNMKKYLDLTPETHQYSRKDKRHNDQTKKVTNEFSECTSMTTSTTTSIDAGEEPDLDKELEKELAKQKKHTREIEKKYSNYLKFFTEKGFDSLADYERSLGYEASENIKTIFYIGRNHQLFLDALPLENDQIERVMKQNKLTCATIIYLTPYICLKRMEKDVFLIVQGMPSCGKTTIAQCMCNQYPQMFRCRTMDAFLNKDLLGMEDVAKKNCQSIFCDEFQFTTTHDKECQRAQNVLKTTLSGGENQYRLNKSNNKNKYENDIARIKIVTACVNDDNKLMKQVDTFLSDLGTSDRTIRLHIKRSYYDLFQKEKRIFTNKDLTDVKKFSAWVKIEVDKILNLNKTDSIKELQNFMKDSWFISEHIDICFNSYHTKTFLDQFDKNEFNMSNLKITDEIIDYELNAVENMVVLHNQGLKFPTINPTASDK